MSSSTFMPGSTGASSTNRFEGVADKAKEVAANVGDKAKEVAANVCDKASQAASSLGDKASQAACAIGEMASDAGCAVEVGTRCLGMKYTGVQSNRGGHE